MNSLLVRPSRPRVDARMLASAAIMVTALLYLVGLDWPLLIVVIATLAGLLPMPKVFSSWFSRSVVALMLTLGIVQIAALVQFLIYPNGKFKLIALLVAMLAIMLLGLFGKSSIIEKRTAISLNDLFILIPSIFFILSFSPVLLSTNKMAKIVAIAAVQVNDSVTHYGVIANGMQIQNLNYKVNSYYPAGFHISTGFVEESLLGNINNASWRTHVFMYVGQYVFFGILMTYCLIYFGYALLKALYPQDDTGAVAYLTVAITAGICTILMHLILFIDAGFLNFFYVCATLLVSATYLLDHEVAYNEKQSLQQNVPTYTWPLSAFLLLGFGASFSWTLLAPAVLLSAGLAMWPSCFRALTVRTRDYLVANISIVVLVLCNLASLYFQYKYLRANNQMFFASGAIRTFNIPFLTTSLLAILFIITRSKLKLAQRLMSVMVPYVILLSLMLLIQLLILGEVRYYVVKTAYVLELFSLAIVTTAVLYTLREAGLGKLAVFLWTTSLVVFIVVGSISLMPLPFAELRNLLMGAYQRGQSTLVKNDARAIASLGMENKIQNFNVTVLHYDVPSDKFYARGETVLWASAMTRAFSDPSLLVSAAKVFGWACFSDQFAIFDYGTGSPEEQMRLIKDVRDCINTAQVAKLPYYIVTDSSSLVMDRQVFGNRPVYIVE